MIAAMVSAAAASALSAPVVAHPDPGRMPNALRIAVKFMAFLNKRHVTNPNRGQFHFRRPSKVLWRAVRGMLPHKGAKGQAALDRLSVFDGCPAPFDKQKKMVVPNALRVIKLRPDRKVRTRAGADATAATSG